MFPRSVSLFVNIPQSLTILSDRECDVTDMWFLKTCQRSIFRTTVKMKVFVRFFTFVWCALPMKRKESPKNFYPSL